MHMVICKYCNEKFDRDTVPCKSIGRRYAHKDCKPTIPSPREKAQRQEILDYIHSINPSANFALIGSQLSNLAKKMKYDEIYLTIRYAVEDWHWDFSKGGIGFVEKSRNEARDYWASITEKRVPKIEKDDITIDLRPRKKKKLLSLDEED